MDGVIKGVGSHGITVACHHPLHRNFISAPTSFTTLNIKSFTLVFSLVYWCTLRPPPLVHMTTCCDMHFKMASK